MLQYYNLTVFQSHRVTISPCVTILPRYNLTVCYNVDGFVMEIKNAEKTLPNAEQGPIPRVDVGIELEVFGEFPLERKKEIVYLAIQKIQKYHYILQAIENKCAVPYQAEASLKHINPTM